MLILDRQLKVKSLRQVMAKHGSQVEQFLASTIKILLMVLMLIPFIYSTIFIQPFVFPKLLFLYTVSSIIIFLYVWLCLVNHKFTPRILPYRENEISATASIFMLVLWLTTLFSENIRTSLIGTVSWTNGLLTITTCYLLFLIVKSVLDREESWQLLFKFNLGIGSAVSVYAIVQQLNAVDPASRSGATFGNPIYLAAYLIFTLASTTLIYIAHKKWNGWKAASVIGFALQLFALVWVTQARSSMLGIGIAAFCVLLVWLINMKKTARRTWVLCVVTVIFLFSVVLSIIPNSKFSLSRAFGRGDTARTRLIGWQIAGRAIIERPLQGFGIENFSIPFEKYYDPTFFDKKSGGVASEHDLNFPHNKILEVASSNGVIAALLYLILFLLIFRKLIIEYRKGRNEKYLVLLGLFATYFVQNLFSFDSLTSYLLFFIFLGYLCVPVDKQIGNPKINTRYVTPEIIISFFLIAMSYYFVAIKPAMAASDGMQAFEALTMKNYKTSEQMMISAHSYNSILVDDFFDREMTKLASDDAKSKTSIGAEQQEFQNYIIDRLKRIIERDPGSIANYSFLSQLYLASASYNPTNIGRSIEIAERALSLGSKRADYYYLLSEAYYKSGKSDLAIDMADKAVELNPMSGYAHSFLGNMYLRLGDERSGFDEINMAISLGYRDRSDQFRLSSYLEQQKK